MRTSIAPEDRRLADPPFYCVSGHFKSRWFVEVEAHGDRHRLKFLEKKAERVGRVHLRHASLVAAIVAGARAIAHDGVLRGRVRQESTRAADGQHRRVRIVQQAVEDHLRRAVGYEALTTEDRYRRPCHSTIVVDFESTARNDHGGGNADTPAACTRPPGSRESRRSSEQTLVHRCRPHSMHHASR